MSHLAPASSRSALFHLDLATRAAPLRIARLRLQGCLLEARLARGDLTDEQWALIVTLLPSERGRKARPAHGNRRFPNGMLHALGVGYPWRGMHERYGKWNSVYVRFRR